MDRRTFFVATIGGLSVPVIGGSTEIPYPWTARRDNFAMQFEQSRESDGWTVAIGRQGDAVGEICYRLSAANKVDVAWVCLMAPPTSDVSFDGLILECNLDAEPRLTASVEYAPACSLPIPKMPSGGFFDDFAKFIPPHLGAPA